MKINEKTGLYENYGLWYVPFWQTNIFKLVIAFVIVALLLTVCISLVVKYVRYRRRKKMSSWDQALFDLAQLKKDHKVTIEHGKEFYAFLTNIVKKYLFSRFDYDVLGKTDIEVIDYLKKLNIDTEIIENVKVLVQGSESIKFANAQAAQDQINKDYNRIILLVRQTIPEKQK